MKSNNTSNIAAIFVVICGIVWLICTVMDYITKHPDKPQSAQSTNYSAQSNSSTPTTQPYSQSVQPQAVSPNNSTEAPYNLCKVRVENSFEHTDKTGGFKARMDSVAQTLTLSYINNPKEVMKLTKQDGGLVLWQLYRNDALEAEKTMYRRKDLEGTNQYVYTSRTEEIKLTIDYN